MKKTKSFTLAEIMIAIAIIGIVAALTIPVFIDYMNGQAYKAKYKKAITTLTRAASANYGENTYDFRDVSGFYGENGTPIECYNRSTGADDGASVGSDTDTTFKGNSQSDLYGKSLSLYNIFSSYINLMPSKMVPNYDVNPVPPEYNCAQNEPSGKTVQIIYGKKNATANIVNTFTGRHSSTKGGFAMFCNGRSVEYGGFNQGRMFMMQDGSVFTYDPSQTYCTVSNPCYGYIDINGSNPPNRVIACSEGEDSYILSYNKTEEEGVLEGTCTVKSKDITDIYPVLFYDQIVKPASWAAKSVLWDHIRSNQVKESHDENNEDDDDEVGEEPSVILASASPDIQSNSPASTHSNSLLRNIINAIVSLVKGKNI